MKSSDQCLPAPFLILIVISAARGSVPILRTCSELKSVGFTTSGVYRIDPDGPRIGVDPFVVYCNQQSPQGTTVILHDQYLRTKVPQGFERYGSYVVRPTYEGATIDQLGVLADVSERCTQYLSLECKGVSMWSKSQVGDLIQWWISRNGTMMKNWATPTGTEGCSCSLNNTCDNNIDKCNCNNNDAIWRKDDGFLSDKATLPVTVMHFGDTGNPAEQSFYHLGPLQCYGIETSAGVCTEQDGHPTEETVCPLWIRSSKTSDPQVMGIELYRNESWDALCSSHWTIENADIICFELGFPRAKSLATLSNNDECGGNVKCEGDETYLAGCSLIDTEGTVPEPTGVTCENKVRLLRGDGAGNEGRVEVFLDYSWKPVCVSSWNLQTADVICKSLEYNHAIASKWQNVPDYFYESKYYIELNCVTGNETSVTECEFEKVYYSLCDASDRGAAAVICNNENTYITSSLEDSPININTSTTILLSWNTMQQNPSVTDNRWELRTSSNHLIKLVMWAYYLSSKTLEFQETSGNTSVSMTWTPVIRAVYSVSASPWLHLTGHPIPMPNVEEGFDMNIIALHETTTPSCGTHSFACFSGVCIDNYGVCDGEQNCPDNSDERYCRVTSDKCPLLLPSNITGSCYLPILAREKGAPTITTSSNASTDLYYGIPQGVWKPNKTDSNPYLQITFADIMIISCIIVEGHWSIRDQWKWVDEFHLRYSYDGSTWKTHEVTTDSVGSPRCESIITLVPQIKASRLRFYPSKEFTKRGILAIRVLEILGCKDNDCDYALGITESINPTPQITSSSQNITLSWLSLVLWGLSSAPGWEPRSDWLQIKMEFQYTINAIVTQGCCKDDSWITVYCLSYLGSDGSEVSYGGQNSTCQHISGNNNCHGLTRHRLAGGILTDSVRLYNFRWKRSPCLKLELQGCRSDVPSCQMGHVAACDRTHSCTARHARIASVGYPDSYYQRSTCTWSIKTEPGTFILLDFLTFDIPSLGQCDSSSLAIYNSQTDEYDALLSTFCNARAPTKRSKSDFNFLYLKFHAGAEEPGQGFLATYEQNQRGEWNVSLQNSNICPTNWTLFKGNCYKVFKFDNFIRWTTAEETCQHHNAHLVSVRDRDDMEFLHSMLLEYVEHQTRTYVGLVLGKASRRHSWVDRRPLSFTDWFSPKDRASWANRQPDGGVLESCSLIHLTNFHSTNHWHDVPCAAENDADQCICMKPSDGQKEMAIKQMVYTPIEQNEYSCPRNMKLCPNFECVHKIHQCIDGNEQSGVDMSTINHLQFGSSRVTIPPRRTCNAGEMQCVLSGECIPVSFVCDFISNCQDNSDEDFCDYGTCKSDEFTCSNGQCLPMAKRCDLLHDCVSGSDEQLCDNPSGFFQCYDGSLMPLHAYCDGQRDCSGKNWEDEPVSCDMYSGNFTCNQLSCKNGACVPLRHRCMYTIDQYGFMAGCRDSTHLADCETFICPNNTLKCPSSYCVPLQYRCDGELGCPNGEDEHLCESYECPGNYRCQGSSNCLLQSQVCDGMKDCLYGDDELFCDVFCPDECTCVGYFYHCGEMQLTAEQIMMISRHTREIHLVEGSISSTQNLLFNHLKKLPFLIAVNLTENSIGHINASTFYGNVNLQYLSLDNNDIEYLYNFTFQRQINLLYLDISGNPLKQVEPGAFTNLGHLETLIMEEITDSIATTDVFTDLTSLQILHSDKYLYCCIISSLKTVTECLPESDQFSSCEDLIREKVLRVFMWLLGISALFGNIFVIGTRFKNTWNGSLQSEATRVQATIVSHLAIADCLMGVYMLIIAFADSYYRNRYAQYAEQWQTSFACKFAGFLSMLSSEASVFFMFAISVDRFLRIVFPFGRLKMRPNVARVVIAIVWVTTGLISLIPVFAKGYFGDEFYGRSTVCLALPLTPDRPAGWQYSVAIFLVVNLFAFLSMAFCYVCIYISVKYASKRLRHYNKKSRIEESQLAMRMAFVVISDLFCWMPIIIMGFLSLNGAVTVPPSIYAWTAVFILPLNSSLNPYLYTLLVRERAKVGVSRERTVTSVTKQDDDVNIESKRQNIFERLRAIQREAERNNVVIDGFINHPNLSTLSDVLDSDTLNVVEKETIEIDLHKAIEFLHQNNMCSGVLDRRRILISKEQGCIQAYLQAYPIDSNAAVTSPVPNTSIDGARTGGKSSDAIQRETDFDNLSKLIKQIERS